MLRLLVGGSIALFSVAEPVRADALYEYRGVDFDTTLSGADPPAGSFTTGPDGWLRPDRRVKLEAEGPAPGALIGLGLAGLASSRTRRRRLSWG